MMGKDEREGVKLPFGEYLNLPDDKKRPYAHRIRPLLAQIKTALLQQCGFIMKD